MDFLNKILIFEKAWSEDKKRKSYLLNFINFTLIVFISLIIIIRVVGEIFFDSPQINKESLLFLFFIILTLLFLIFLVKKGFVRSVSFLLVTLLLIASLKGSFKWGIDLYTVDIVYPLIILMSAILINSKFSFFILIFIFLNLTLVFLLQKNGLISNYSWKYSLPSYLNLLTMLIIYLLMSLISWLSSKEIEKSLIKTKELAKQLKFHNDNLELLIEERTKELKNLQLKQLVNIAPLLDLGKLSAGLIHDIREPLSVLSIILQNAKQNKNLVLDMDQAFLAIDKIDELSKISSCKVFSKPEIEYFELNKEIDKLISLFEYKARENKVKLVFTSNKTFDLFADRKKLNQVLANLILNAMESYDGLIKKEKYIFIKLIKKQKSLFIKIKDYGIGINSKDLNCIFEPNFSSKDNCKSLGLGLYISQEIMKNIFNSKIKVESAPKKGSTFTVFIRKKFLLD